MVVAFAIQSNESGQEGRNREAQRQFQLNLQVHLNVLALAASIFCCESLDQAIDTKMRIGQTVKLHKFLDNSPNSV